MEELKKLLGDDLFNQVSTKLGDKQLTLHEKNQKLMVDDGSYVKKDGMIPKDRFDEVNNKKNEFESKINELMGQVDNLKKSAGNKQELEAKIQKMTDDYNNLKSEAEKSKETTKKKFALRDALRDGGAKPEYVDLLEVKYNIDQLVIGDDGKLTKVKVSDDESKPFAEHLESIKKSYPDAFGSIKRMGLPPKEGNDPPGGFYTKEEVKAMSPADRVKNIDKINASTAHWNEQST